MAHSAEEYQQVAQTALNKAQAVARAARGDRQPEAAKVMKFLIRHGLLAYPTGAIDQYRVGSWLLHGKTQIDEQDAENALKLVFCFDDDVAPFASERCFERTDSKTTYVTASFWSDTFRAVVLRNVNWFSPLELAINFLHEARHAYNAFGFWEGLPQLESNSEEHEIATWGFCFRLLDIAGGEPWQEAVNELLPTINTRMTMGGADPSRRFVPRFEASEYHPNLDRVFGQTDRDEVKCSRQFLLSLRAGVAVAIKSGWLTWKQACTNVVGLALQRAQEAKKELG